MTDTNRDIVERLREAAGSPSRAARGNPATLQIVSIPAQDTDVDVVCFEAADEIEQLREEKKRLQEKNEWLWLAMEEERATALSPATIERFKSGGRP